MPKQKLDDALAQLGSAELLFRRGTPPDAEYTFKHALVQDAAYGTLLRRRRQKLHGRVTATLEERFPEIVESQRELLARHCGDAGFVDKTAGYLLKADQQAMSRGALAKAVAQLRKGLDLVSGVPDGAARQEQELNLLITLGQALMATKGYSAPEPGEAFAHAGYVDQARSRRDEALAEARQLPLYTRAWALSQTWYLDRALESAPTIPRSANEVLAFRASRASRCLSDGEK
jgi:predicted ATPase